MPKRVLTSNSVFAVLLEHTLPSDTRPERETMRELTPSSSVDQQFQRPNGWKRDLMRGSRGVVSKTGEAHAGLDHDFEQDAGGREKGSPNDAAVVADIHLVPQFRGVPPTANSETDVRAEQT